MKKINFDLQSLYERRCRNEGPFSLSSSATFRQFVNARQHN